MKQNHKIAISILLVMLTLASAISTAIAADASWSKASDWAVPELQKALDAGIYPAKLLNMDMTKDITRAEFAAVAVRLYEVLSGTTAAEAPQDTFTDTKDADVLKAYAADLVGGIGDGLFDPNGLLNREQAAAMLSRVYKKVKWEGWTLESDASYTANSLDIADAPTFGDSGAVADWASKSVLFMSKYGIVNGVGDGFAPQGSAAREQALAIAVRLFDAYPTIQDGGPVQPAEPEIPVAEFVMEVGRNPTSAPGVPVIVILQDIIIGEKVFNRGKTFPLEKESTEEFGMVIYAWKLYKLSPEWYRVIDYINGSEY